MKCSLGNAPHGDGPVSCRGPLRKCSLVVAAHPVLPIAEMVDAEFWGSSSALSVRSTSWQRAPLLVCGHSCLPWWPPLPVQPWPAALCLLSQTMGHDTSLGKICLGSQREAGDSCLLWFGLCCSDVYPVWPTVWYMIVSTNMW